MSTHNPYRSAEASGGDDIAARFAHDKFLLNQKTLSLGNKYYIYDESNRPLFYVDRPVLKLKALITVYADDTKTRKVMTLQQNSALIALDLSFSLTDEQDRLVATLKRQGLRSLLRRTWKIFDPAGVEIAQAHEDSWWKAVLRRVTDIGDFLRTNFIVTRPDGRTPLGAFLRRLTLGDKYVMDVSADAPRTLDRRIVVALAVVLDNAESR